MFSGGDILEISYKHPTLGSGVLFPKSAEDFTLDPGGFRSNDDANMITASGEMIDQINRVRWSMEGPVGWDMAVKDELAQMSRLSASPILADWTFTHINGTIWGGKGKPVGDLNGNTNTAQMSLKIAGERNLVPIS
jgi:hypothetical protein